MVKTTQTARKKQRRNTRTEDTVLVQAFRCHDSIHHHPQQLFEATQDLVRKVYLKHYAHLRLCEADVDDLLQLGYCLVWELVQRPRPYDLRVFKLNLCKWLRGHYWRWIKYIFQRNRRQHLTDVKYLKNVAIPVDDESPQDFGSLTSAMEECLSPVQSETMYLLHFEGLTQGEAAERRGVHRRTVIHAVEAATYNLRKYLKVKPVSKTAA